MENQLKTLYNSAPKNEAKEIKVKIMALTGWSLDQWKKRITTVVPLTKSERFVIEYVKAGYIDSTEGVKNICGVCGSKNKFVS